MGNAKIGWAKQKIEKAIEQAGPYSHNICAMALMTVAEADGREAANRLIEGYGLDVLYGIRKVASS